MTDAALAHWLVYAWAVFTSWVTVCSILSWVLPPPEILDDAPGAVKALQPWYRFLCKLIKWFGALDLRGKVNPALFPQSWEKIRNGSGNGNGNGGSAGGPVAPQSNS